MVAALQVRVAIEEHDIKDLEDAIAVTKKTDIMKLTFHRGGLLLTCA